MDINGNLNQPVNFYTKNTGNNINYAIPSENHIVATNVFAPEMQTLVNTIQKSSIFTKRKKSKRFNTVDTDYLPDETEENLDEDNSNFFLKSKNNSINSTIKRIFHQFISKTPLINYFFLRNKKENIKRTVATLTDIGQNVDELMNTIVPFGEESKLYNDIAQNLTKVANLVSETNKKSW